MATKDNDLFRRSVGEVRPLRVKPTIERARKPRSVAVTTQDRQARADRVAVQKSGETEIHLQAGQQRRQLRQLSGQNFRAQADIDLHGLTVPQARSYLSSFLDESVRAGHQRLRVVHGKGHHSAQGHPVLKNMVEAYLRTNMDVLAFRNASISDGGSGATRVLLRGRR